MKPEKKVPMCFVKQMKKEDVPLVSFFDTDFLQLNV